MSQTHSINVYEHLLFARHCSVHPTKNLVLAEFAF